MTRILRSLRENGGLAALVVASIAFVASVTGAADAAKQKIRGPSLKPRPYGVLALGKNAKFPAKAIPRVARARRADRLGEQTAGDLTMNCPETTVDLGTWCLETSPHPLPGQDVGKNNYFYASVACVDDGGFLPSADQLIGAADHVKLASTIDDERLTATIDLDPSDGLKDRREMSSTLVTTQAGSSAAGSEGVTDGSRGDPKAGEPDPVPLPANPQPETTQYVTVYDNRNKGGFAGAKPVSQPETFRCGYYKRQGEAAGEGG